MPSKIKKRIRIAGRQAKRALSGKKVKSLAEQAAERVKNIQWDPKQWNDEEVDEYASWMRIGLVVLAVFLLAEVASRLSGLFVRPTYTNLPAKKVTTTSPFKPTEDYDTILSRNMFNVEGKIPEPFDQGLLDCFSQAKMTTQRISLLGTIVMGDESLSVALLQEEGGGPKVGVKKGELFFDGKYEAMKVERKRLCFQVKATQDLEVVEIPEEGGGFGATLGGGFGGGGEGITPVSESEFSVKRDYLDKQLLNLNDVLQTAKAVPYVDNSTGKFKGFLIQSIEDTSPFKTLGMRQGDVLSAVNAIQLDNPGKGLEAFQALRGTPEITLKVIRGGQEMTISYKVK